MKIGVANTNPIQFLALRSTSALILLFLGLLLVPAFSRNKGNAGRLKIRELFTGPAFRDGFIVGLFLLAGFLLQVSGLKYTSASRSGFFTSLLVVLVPPLAFIFKTSKVHPLIWFGLLPAVGGVYLLADPGSGGLNKGDLLTIACALVFASQMIVLETVMKKRHNTWVLTFAQLVALSLGSIAWSVIEQQPFVIEASGWIAVGYTAVFGSLIAIWLQTRFQPEVPASHAAIIFILEPVFASLFAWILLGEIWTLRGLAGAGMILAAMFISSFASLNPSKS